MCAPIPRHAFLRPRALLLAGVALAASQAPGLAAPPAQPYVADSAPPPAGAVSITGVKTYSSMVIGGNNPGQNVSINGIVSSLGAVTAGQGAGSTGNLLTVGSGGLLIDYAAPVFVGDASSENTLAVNSGGIVTVLEVVAGNQAGSNANQVVIDGTLGNAISGLYLGVAGSSNSFALQNGGSLMSSIAIIGNDAGSSFNTATVTGTDTAWDINGTTGTMVVGLSGDDNLLQVTDSARLSLTGASGANIMLGALGGDRNSLFIGYGGAVSHPGDIYVGENGTDNQLNLYFSGTLDSGGNAYVGGGPDYSAAAYSVARDYAADNNLVVVDGMATAWTIGKALYIGAGQVTTSTNNNQVSVQYGGRLSAGAGIFLGFDGSSIGNTLAVSGVDAADIPNPSLLTTTDIRIGITAEDVEANVSTGNSVMAGSEDAGAYGGTIQADRIFVGSGNGLVLGGGGLIEAGSIAFGNAADYRVHVNSTARGALNVSGSAALGGTVSMSFGEQFDNRYVILSSGDATGAFTLDTSNLSPDLSAVLDTTITPDSTEVAILFTSSFAAAPGLDANQLSVATSLDTAFNSGSSISGELATAQPAPADPPPPAPLAAAPMALGAAPLRLPAEPVPGRRGERLSRLTGEVGASGGTLALEQAGRSFLALLVEQGSEAPAKDKALWSSAYGVTATTAGNDTVGSHDTDTEAMGLATGWAYRLSPETMLGVAVAAGTTGWSLSDDLGSGESTFLQLGFHGEHRAGAAYVAAAGGLAWHGMSTSRMVALRSRNDYASQYSGQDAALRLEGGYRLGAENGFGLTPYAALEGHVIGIDSHDETAASGRGAFALSYDSTLTQTLRSEIGLAVDSGGLLQDERFSIGARAAWSHAWTAGDDGAVAVEFQSIDDAQFTVQGAQEPENTLRASADISAWVTDSLALSARFEGEFGEGYESLAGGLSLDFPL